jgi:hypothetical protein
MVTDPVAGTEQDGVPAVETLTSTKVVVAVYVAVRVAVPDAFSVTVCGVPFAV